LFSAKPNFAFSTIQSTLFPYAFASIGLYAFWLYVLYDTGAKLSSISYNRILTIEEALGNKIGYNFGIHQYIFKKTRKGNTDIAQDWLKIRRSFWGIILLGISMAWVILSII